MEQIGLDVLCLADYSFRKSFQNYSRVISNSLCFVNKALTESGIILNPSINKWDVSQSSYFNDYLDVLADEKRDYNIAIGFTDRVLLPGYSKVGQVGESLPIKIKSLFKTNLPAAGMANRSKKLRVLQNFLQSKFRTCMNSAFLN